LKSLAADGIVIVPSGRCTMSKSQQQELKPTAATIRSIGRVETDLKALGERMDERFVKVDERFAKVDTRCESLEAEVQKLRLLEESNADQIKNVAEVQSHHRSLTITPGALQPSKRPAATRLRRKSKKMR
jgi:hypothetical protein